MVRGAVGARGQEPAEGGRGWWCSRLAGGETGEPHAGLVPNTGIINTLYAPIYNLYGHPSVSTLSYLGTRFLLYS